MTKILAIVAIIVSSLVSGITVYRWQNLNIYKSPTTVSNPQLSLLQKIKSVFFKENIPNVPAPIISSPNPQASSMATGLSTPTPTITATTVATSTPVSNDLKEAQAVLENFFKLASSKNYEQASNLLAWDNLENKSEIDQWYSDTQTKTLQNYCENVGTCLKVKSAVGKKISDSEYSFEVQFVTDSGEVLTIYLPGGMQEGGVSTFTFKVKKINGSFKLITGPVFRS